MKATRSARRTSCVRSSRWRTARSWTTGTSGWPPRRHEGQARPARGQRPGDRHADPPARAGGRRRQRGAAQTAGGVRACRLRDTCTESPSSRISSALAWTTLALTLTPTARPSTSSRPSTFPRHWVYQEARREERPHRLQGVVPQGVRREHALGQGGLGAVRDRRRDALEREISPSIMRSGMSSKPRTLEADEELVEQGEQSDELYLLLDGVLAAGRRRDGRRDRARRGPGRAGGARGCAHGDPTRSHAGESGLHLVRRLDPSVLQELAAVAAARSSPSPRRGRRPRPCAVLHPHGRAGAFAMSPRRVDRTSYRRSSLSPLARAHGHA